VRLLGVFLFPRRALRRTRVLPSVVMLGHELGGSLGTGEIVLAMGGVYLGVGVATARVLGGARVLGAIDLLCHAPRGTAREIARRELAAMEPRSLGPGRGFERTFQLALTPFGAFRLVPCRFDVTQRLRQRADLLVDGCFSDSPERVERVFTRHDA